MSVIDDQIKKHAAAINAATFTCFDMFTGNAANCPDFDYECWGH